MSYYINTPNEITPEEHSIMDRDSHFDRRLGLFESIKSQPIVYIIWIISIVICLVVYGYAIGFKTKFSKFLAIILVLILVVNMYLSGIDSIDAYEREIELYSYVEQNARAFLPFGIALAALIIATSSKGNSALKSEYFMMPILVATTAFVLVLTIVWVPKDSGLPIRLLRDIKTSLLTLGGITVVYFVGEFVFTLTGKR